LSDLNVIIWKSDQASACDINSGKSSKKKRKNVVILRRSSVPERGESTPSKSETTPQLGCPADPEPVNQD
jgi:hypothetical protein